MTDALEVVRQSVYAALSRINADTKEGYPPSVFDDAAGLSLPMTAYTVELGAGTTMANRQERFIDVTANVDHFGRSRAELGTLGAESRAAMLAVLPSCTLDRHTVMANGLIRRSQSFHGRIDTQTGETFVRR